MRNDPTILRKQAEDLESTMVGNWIQASSATSQRLSNKVKEPIEVFLYPLARFEITYNLDGHFSQGQLAVLSSIPCQSDIDHFQPLHILTAPPGCKQFPIEATRPDQFISLGWKEQTIGPAHEIVHSITGHIKAKRKQYGLCHRLAATIHAAMGQTLESLVTKISKDDDYSLWDKKQITVLLSRIRKADQFFLLATPGRQLKQFLNSSCTKTSSVNT